MWKRALLGYEKASQSSSEFRVCLNLGKLYLENCKLNEAETLLERALKGYENDPSENMFMSIALQNLSLLYHLRGELDKAEAMWVRALAGYKKLPDLEDLYMTRAAEELGEMFHNCKKYKEAEIMLKKAQAGYLKVYEKLSALYHDLQNRSRRNIGKKYAVAVRVWIAFGYRSGKYWTYGQVTDLYICSEKRYSHIFEYFGSAAPTSHSWENVFVSVI